MNLTFNHKSSLGGYLPFTAVCIATAGRSMLNMRKFYTNGTRPKGIQYVTFNCDHCSKPHRRCAGDFRKAVNHFCSHHCSAEWAKLNPYREGGRAIPGKPVGKFRNTDEELRRRLVGFYEDIGMSPCWEWQGEYDPYGYGRFWDGRCNQRAHRLVYELRVGPIPDGLVIDHLCRNKGCVNPNHLEPVTVRVNTLRGLAPSALNAAKTHCKRGHPFSQDNTHIDTKGKRVCKTCRNEKRWNEAARAKGRERYHRRKAKAEQHEPS